MERITELEKELGDTQLNKIEILLHDNPISNSGEKGISIQFSRNDNSEFKLLLMNPSRFDYYEDNFSGQYIGTIKCFLVDGIVQISLDPYDERIDSITEKDNFNIFCREYKIIEMENKRNNEA